ncbi:hypothetical protein JXB12_00185, partial [candidate division KSB1 bacterium]|nr:hypothetical protein [candidate division KSB1 bacterium]
HYSQESVLVKFTVGWWLGSVASVLSVVKKIKNYQIYIAFTLFFLYISRQLMILFQQVNLSRYSQLIALKKMNFYKDYQYNKVEKIIEINCNK